MDGKLSGEFDELCNFENMFCFPKMGSAVPVVFFMYVGVIVAYVGYTTLKEIAHACKKKLTRLAIHGAVYNNDTDTVIKFINNDPSIINMYDINEYTPFLRACRHGNTRLVKYMLEHGADVHSCTGSKENGFLLAVFDRINHMGDKDASCIHALYHADIDINSPNIHGINAIQLAAMCGHNPLVQWLVSKNANIDVIPSPYFLAIRSGHKETARMLKSHYALQN